jgi:hypothetical protein
MATFGYFSFSEPFKPGIDFYTADNADVFIIIQVDSAVTTNITKIAYAAASIAIDGAVVTVGTEELAALVSMSGSVDLTVSATKIAYASASLSCDCSTTTTVTKTAFAQTILSGDVSVTTTVTKTAKAVVNLSGDTSVSTSAIKTAFGATQLSGNASLSVNATRIKLLSAILSGQSNLSVIGKTVLITIRIPNVFGNTNVTARAIKFSDNFDPDTTLIRTLLILDSRPLTNQSRTLSVSKAPIFVENINWAGDSSRYYKNSSNAGKRKFDIRWSFIPNYSNKTVDLNESRNYIKQLANDPDIHTLTIVKQDENGNDVYSEENLSVIISGFNENLIRRDLADGVYYFDCSLTLEEV